MTFSIIIAALLSAPQLTQLPRQDSIDLLIKKLGSSHFRKRELAAQQLLDRMPESEKALRKALKSIDPEIALRAKSILDAYDRACQQRMLSRLRFFAKVGKVDLAAELLARWPKNDFDKHSWIEASKLTFRLAQSLKQPNNNLGPTLLNIQKEKSPIVIDAEQFTDFRRQRGGLLFVRAKQADISSISDAWCGTVMFVAGNLRIRRSRYLASAAYVCGSVHGGAAFGVIIVADGDVNLDGGLGVNNSVIVARGNVHCREVRNCLIVSGKSFSCKRPVGENCTIVENEPNALGFIQFFDPAKEGITVEQGKNAVKIKHLAAKKPYAKAGLQNGDTIISINSGHVTSPENFRRVLRKHVAWEEEMTFRVVRGGKELQIKLRPLVLP